MSSLQYNQPGSLMSLEDSPQSLAPRSAMSMEEMIALMSSGSQLSNDSTAAAAAASRSWRQAGDANYVTSTIAATGGHRRNHEWRNQLLARNQLFPPLTHSLSEGSSLGFGALFKSNLANLIFSSCFGDFFFSLSFSFYAPPKLCFIIFILQCTPKSFFF